MGEGSKEGEAGGGGRELLGVSGGRRKHGRRRGERKVTTWGGEGSGVSPLAREKGGREGWLGRSGRRKGRGRKERWGGRRGEGFGWGGPLAGGGGKKSRGRRWLDYMGFDPSKRNARVAARLKKKKDFSFFKPFQTEKYKSQRNKINQYIYIWYYIPKKSENKSLPK